MARPKKAETMTTVSIRLPNSILEQVDACAKQLQEDMPLLQVTRTDAIRYLIQLGMIEFEGKGTKRARR